MLSLTSRLAYALRVLIQRPFVSAFSILMLGLGIGAATAIYGVVRGVLVDPLPYPQPELIVSISEVKSDGSTMMVAAPSFFDWKQRSRRFAAIAAYTGFQTRVAAGTENLPAGLAYVSRDFFQVFASRPFLGRSFSEEECRPGGLQAAVVSYRLWASALQGSTDLSCLHVRVMNEEVPVVGVMPPGFGFPNGADLWMPAEYYRQFSRESSRLSHNWRVVARLQDRASLTAARDEVSSITRRLKSEFGSDMDAAEARLVPLREALVEEVRSGLLIWLGAVFVLLLVACANVANLLAANVGSRRRELTDRVAQGAGRRDLILQFLTESSLLALCAGVLGLVLSMWGVGMLRLAAWGSLPRVEEVQIDLGVTLFALSITAATALALGLTMTVRVFARDLFHFLKKGRRSMSGLGGPCAGFS